MQFEGTSGIRVTQAGHRVLISRKSSPVEIRAAAQQENVLSGLGFFAYRHYQEASSTWSVVVSSGVLQVVVAGTDPYGRYSSYNSGSGAVMGAQTCDDLFPSTDGFLVFTFASSFSASRPAGEPGEAGNPATVTVDFGDPAGDYFVGADVGQAFNDSRIPLVNTEDGQFEMAVVFTTGPPTPSSDYFQRIIARVVTDAAGVPTVYQVHIGDIEVPLAAEGYINGFAANLIS